MGSSGKPVSDFDKNIAENTEGLSISTNIRHCHAWCYNIKKKKYLDFLAINPRANVKLENRFRCINDKY